MYLAYEDHSRFCGAGQGHLRQSLGSSIPTQPKPPTGRPRFRPPHRRPPVPQPKWRPVPKPRPVAPGPSPRVTPPPSPPFFTPCVSISAHLRWLRVALARRNISQSKILAELIIDELGASPDRVFCKGDYLLLWRRVTGLPWDPRLSAVRKALLGAIQAGFTRAPDRPCSGCWF